MKKYIKFLSVFAISVLFSHLAKAQNNSLGIHDDLMQITLDIGKHVKAPKVIGSYDMLQNIDLTVTNELAWKYLLNKNEYVKPEESECHGVATTYNAADDIFTVVFYRGNSNSLFYLLQIATFKGKSGKYIDGYLGVGGFAKTNSACSLSFLPNNKILIETLAGDMTKINLAISKSGKIKEDK